MIWNVGSVRFRLKVESNAGGQGLYSDWATGSMFVVRVRN